MTQGNEKQWLLIVAHISFIQIFGYVARDSVTFFHTNGIKWLWLKSVYTRLFKSYDFFIMIHKVSNIKSEDIVNNM